MKHIIITFLSIFFSFTSFAIGQITGATSVCAGGTTTLSDTSSGGTWTCSNHSIAAIGSTSGIVTGVSSGTATITYTVGLSFATTTITVNPLPASISGATSVSAGSAIPLVDATPFGSWSTSNPSIAMCAAVPGVIAGVSSGTASISYILPTGCSTAISLTVY